MRFDHQVDVAPVTRNLFHGNLKIKIVIQLSGIDQGRRAGLSFQEIPPLTSFGRDDKTPHPPFGHYRILNLRRNVTTASACFG